MESSENNYQIRISSSEETLSDNEDVNSKTGLPQKYGLVWERSEEEYQTALHQDYISLDIDPRLSIGEAPFRNLIIEGDNFDVLRALRITHTNLIKCIYIDPPYNTGNKFLYKDQFFNRKHQYRHSEWIEFIYRRILLSKDLLSEDGVIFISIDDREIHHLKGVMNEVFGEKNNVATIVWQKCYAPKNSTYHFSTSHEYVLVYALNKEKWRPHLFPRSESTDKTYKNMDNDPRGAWKASGFLKHNTIEEGHTNFLYPIISPDGRIIEPDIGKHWRLKEETFKNLESEGRIWWGKEGDGNPRLKVFLSEVKQGIVPQTFWTGDQSGTNLIILK